MKKVYAAPDSLSAGHVRNLLQQAGIDARLRNQYLTGGVGDLPVNECWPEVWVDDSDELRALSLLAELKAQTARPGPDWVCPQCGEVNEGQFSECWRCGAQRKSLE
ncbi:DUF2007 domain-containing protein [Acidihalobacter ferrooxydans]|uniref:RanBP2-type domain-containing protein n=1 Tax=Acidihalobacter ferrooxydans TaxID=1765967 RepID=A0A1P8UJM4_9GAMM|nr:DUF2007 domain-containing protein [Acidihalobacter ferrooxydans]APZ44029.1 hypothetical protein BW247_13775 [Acidihalobacter ferrooxydans]